MRRRAARMAGATVSVRRMRFPREMVCMLVVWACFISLSLQPPSGPMSMLIVLDFFNVVRRWCRCVSFSFS